MDPTGTFFYSTLENYSYILYFILSSNLQGEENWKIAKNIVRILKQTEQENIIVDCTKKLRILEGDDVCYCSGYAMTMYVSRMCIVIYNSRVPYAWGDKFGFLSERDNLKSCQWLFPYNSLVKGDTMRFNKTFLNGANAFVPCDSSRYVQLFRTPLSFVASSILALRFCRSEVWFRILLNRLYICILLPTNRN